MASGQCVHTLRGHNDEILDVCYNATGSKLSTASADGTSRIFNTMTGACQAILIGHEGEISKVCFNPQGSRVLTASSDKTARIWDVETGDCLQILEGHTDEIFSCAFNYEGETIITGSKDNTCRVRSVASASLAPRVVLRGLISAPCRPNASSMPCLTCACRVRRIPTVTPK